MANLLIATMNLFGTVFFLLAVLWGLFNYREQVEVTEFWAIYAAAAFSGAGFLSVRTMEWAGVAPSLLDSVAPMFGIVGITMLGTTATICALSPVKHQVK